MPKYRRHFPVSQSINSDPEVWELTDTFGDWAIRVWLQILAATDSTEGELRGKKEWIAYSMSTLWRSNSRRYNTKWRLNKVLLMLEWMSNKGWIIIELDRILVAKFWDYHKRREPNRNPDEDKQAPSLPSLPSLPTKEDIQASPVPIEVTKEPDKPQAKKNEPWRPVANRIFKSDPERFARIMVFINTAKSEGFTEKVVAVGLEGFENALNNGLLDGSSDWWAYARECVKKSQVREESRRIESDHNRLKAEERRHVAAVTGVRRG